MQIDIHERARRLVAQSPRPMSRERAYQILGQRGQASTARKNYGRTEISQADRKAVDQSFGRELRLPYRDD